MMYSWITTVGTSPFAVINTIWAACKSNEYIPDNVWLIINEQIESHNVDTVKDWISEILIAYEIKKPSINDITIDETDFDCLKDVFVSNIQRLEQMGEVAVDITPGRKYMSAIAMQCGLLAGANKIYYLFLSDPQYQNMAFPLIPAPKQRLFEMISGQKGRV